MAMEMRSRDRRVPRTNAEVVRLCLEFLVQYITTVCRDGRSPDERGIGGTAPQFGG
jgi:hypothetical protein